jgi:hypothetical protein
MSMKVKKPPFFQAQWGDVITNTPYHRPNLESFTKWWLDFKNIKGLEDYDIWFSGSYCEKLFGSYKGIPRDVDIFLTGKINDEENLKYILSHAVQMGFENKILIDISWQNKLFDYNKWEPFCKVRLGKTFTKILGDKVEVSTYHADEEEQLESGLWGFCFHNPPHSWFKAYTRIEEGQYEGLVADLRGVFE